MKNVMKSHKIWFWKLYGNPVISTLCVWFDQQKFVLINDNSFWNTINQSIPVLGFQGLSSFLVGQSYWRLENFEFRQIRNKMTNFYVKFEKFQELLLIVDFGQVNLLHFFVCWFRLITIWSDMDLESRTISDKSRKLKRINCAVAPQVADFFLHFY